MWEIEFTNTLALTELIKSINSGPIAENGLHKLEEEQVDQLGELKISIFSDEHPPPHFCVKLGSKSNNFTIKDCLPLNGTELKKYFRNIKKWHSDHKKDLIDTWNRTRPSNCTVGDYKE